METDVIASSYGPAGDIAGFAAALRAAISARGLSLERIRYHLRHRGHDLSVATLSYWQSGRSRPDRAGSLAALGSLEEILDVPRGSLAALLPARVRRSGSGASEIPPVAEMFDAGSLVDAAVEELGIAWEELDHVTTHDLLELRADRSVASHLIREVLRATRDGVDRFLAFYGDDPGGTPYIVARDNCRLGRVIEHPAVGLVVAELLLNQPLAMGDTVLVEYEYAIVGSLESCDGWERGFTQSQREILIEVEFDPDALSAGVRTRIHHGDEDRSETATLNGNLLSTLYLDFGPGMIGLYWSW
ncbi:MAG: hypothetical protein IPI32_08465 [Austwickia sp.]|nr:hypothetical protein [Austwickia sp.]